MKRILIVMALLSIVVLSGCNPYSGNWDRESCRIAGYEEPIKLDRKDIVKCRDKCGSLEVGIHYKKLEILRQFPDTKIQVDYVKRIGIGWCECSKCVCETCYEEKYIDDLRHPACKGWCNEGEKYDWSSCYHNCQSTKKVCEPKPELSCN